VAFHCKKALAAILGSKLFGEVFCRISTARDATISCYRNTTLTNQPVINDLILSSTSRVCVQYHIAVSTKHLTGVFTFQLDRSVRRVFSPLHSPDLTSTPHFSTHGWRLGVVVSVVGRINEVNQHRARLVHDGRPGMRVNHL